MNLKRIVLGFAALATLGSAPAFAAPPDVSARQLQAKNALSVFDLGLAGDRVMVTQDGRRDLVMVSNQGRAEVLDSLKGAYAHERRLPNGYRVAGWAHIAATDSHTFTLLNDSGERLVAEVSADARGTKVKLWGGSRSANPAQRPLNQIPRRFANN